MTTGTGLSERLLTGAARIRKSGLFREECLEIEQAADLIDDLVGAIRRSLVLLNGVRHDAPTAEAIAILHAARKAAEQKSDAALAKAKP